VCSSDLLGDSAERALLELGDRVPDLILTSALLSSKDEAAVADRVRSLDGAAAHVQTLTIPVLGAPVPRLHPGRGVLSALLGDRVPGPAAPDGCDPAVFAEQCAAYLERAAAEREPGTPIDPPPPAATMALAAPVAPPPAAAPAPEPAPPPAPPALVEPAEEGIEIDLSSMLDESVVRQLSAAIETVSRDAHASPPSPPPAPRPRKRFPDRKPLQDECGFFDPAQCGFAALLAKLDEITRVASSLPANEHPAGSPDVSH